MKPLVIKTYEEVVLGKKTPKKSLTKFKLTDYQIEDIVETLHYNIQYFDKEGKQANRRYNSKIIGVLRRYYGPKAIKIK